MWGTVEFGKAHRGTSGALLPDRSDPQPVLFDGGSGANFQSDGAHEPLEDAGRDLADYLSGGWRYVTHPTTSTSWRPSPARTAATPTCAATSLRCTPPPARSRPAGA